VRQYKVGYPSDSLASCCQKFWPACRPHYTERRPSKLVERAGNLYTVRYSLTVDRCDGRIRRTFTERCVDTSMPAERTIKIPLAVHSASWPAYDLIIASFLWYRRNHRVQAEHVKQTGISTSMLDRSLPELTMGHILTRDPWPSPRLWLDESITTTHEPWWVHGLPSLLCNDVKSGIPHGYDYSVNIL